MKKIVIIVCTFLFCGCFLIACSYSLASKVKNNISEISDLLFVGDNQDFFVTLTGGQRENPYLHDGNSMQKIQFAVVCVTFFVATNEDTIPCEITINEQKYQGQLEKNPFTPNYMTDLQITINQNDTILFEMQEKGVNLECKSMSFVTTSQNAIDISLENLNNELLGQFSNNKFNAECYLKIINNPFQDKNIFYWFFTVRSSNQTICTIIIDTMSSSVLAKY